MGAKRRLNGTSKVNRQTNTQTHKHTDGQIDLYKASAQRADALKTRGVLFWCFRMEGAWAALINVKMSSLTVSSKEHISIGFVEDTKCIT